MSRSTNKEELEIINRYKQGITITKISKDLNVGNITIKYVLAKHKMYKVSIPIDVNILINDYKNGISLTKMQSKYGIRRQNIALALMYEGYDVINKWNKVKFNEHTFDIIDNEEKAYWLGFIYADGYVASIPKNRKPLYTFEISLKGDDYHHLEKFRDFIKYNGQGKIVMSDVVCNNKTYNRCRFFITNKYFWQSLVEKGCVPNKSLVLRFPPLNIFKDVSLIVPFVRGYFDGDGCLSFQMNKKSVSPNVSILGTEVLNISAKIFKNKRHQGNTWTLYFSRKNSFLFLDKIYKNSSIYLDRKYYRYMFFETTCHSLEEFNEFFGQKR